MEFQDFIKKAKEVKKKYDQVSSKQWGPSEHVQGLVGDVGDLTKLIMAKEGFRATDNIDEKLAHELSDCLWAIIIIADQLTIDLEAEFNKQMDILKVRIK